MLHFIQQGMILRKGPNRCNLVKKEGSIVGTAKASYPMSTAGGRRTQGSLFAYLNIKKCIGYLSELRVPILHAVPFYPRFTDSASVSQMFLQLPHTHLLKLLIFTISLMTFVLNNPEICV